MEEYPKTYLEEKLYIVQAILASPPTIFKAIIT